ncbi:MAG: DUF1570 domain-containing protein [Acidobacteriaceae bacterium]|nr:DUF1570 domain-containing protein [Acidobacteriaceae bacterium]
MRKQLVVIALLLFSSAVARAAAGTWLEVRGPHFVVATDGNEKQARRTAVQFEQMRSVFQKLFPGAVSNIDPPIYVVAVKDHKGFQALGPSAYQGRNSLQLAGLFMTSNDKNLILLRLDAEGEHPFSVVYHEYTHYLLRKSTAMPLWMNEGLAEFYENTDIEDKDVALGQPSANDILYLRQNQLIPLETLFRVDYNSPYYHEEQKGSVFYAESWALAHYLMITDNMHKTHMLQQYGQLVGQGEDPVSAAQHAFGDLHKLNMALYTYVQSGDYRYFRIPSAFVADPASFTVRTLPDAEVGAARAEVLIHTGRQQDSEAILTAALQADPNSARAHEVMGYLKYSQGNITDARKLFAEAVQLKSDSYLAYYYDAVMTLQEGIDGKDDEVESCLRNVIKMNRAYAPAYDALGMFFAVRSKNHDEAHTLITQAVQLEPSNLHYRMDGANEMAEAGNYANAIRVLHTAAQVAKTPQESQMVKDRIHEIERRQTEVSSAPAAADDRTGVTMTMMVGGRPVSGDAQPGGSDKAFEPKYPLDAASGPHHTAVGTIRGVECSYPAILAFSLEQKGKTLALYSANYYKTTYTTVGFVMSDEMNPCKALEGMQASVEYADVTGKTAPGQVVSIELRK